jgi:methionyl-tRNA formyltransferase
VTRTGSSPSPARTVFFGSGSFAVPILETLAAMPTLVIVGVVTAPDRPSGRSGTLTPTPVAVRAAALGLPVLRPERVRTPDAVAAIAALTPDLGVLADYGRIVPASILELPAHGILNVHPSLLPRHRGATPIPATIASGDASAGVSIILMDDGIDTGPIVAQAAWPLEGTERAPDLEATAARRGADLLHRTIPGWLAGKQPAVAQDDAAATSTRPFRREDARLDPARPALELERQVRANAPWPGTFLETTEGRLAVLSASVAPPVGAAPGTLTVDGLETVDGLLRLDLVQPAGGRPMAWSAYLRGRPGIVGSAVTGR